MSSSCGRSSLVNIVGDRDMNELMSEVSEASGTPRTLKANRKLKTKKNMWKKPSPVVFQGNIIPLWLDRHTMILAAPGITIFFLHIKAF